MQKAIITTREECLALLAELQIKFHLHEHEAVFNMEEMGQKVKLNSSPFIKSLLFSDKKPNAHYMIIA
jgi:hypothetical protein